MSNTVARSASGKSRTERLVMTMARGISVELTLTFVLGRGSEAQDFLHHG